MVGSGGLPERGGSSWPPVPPPIPWKLPGDGGMGVLRAGPEAESQPGQESEFSLSPAHFNPSLGKI